MKKKINVSVATLMNRGKISNEAEINKENLQTGNTSAVFDASRMKNVRFEQMYSMIKNNNTPGSDKTVLQSKKQTPKSTHRNLSIFECKKKKTYRHQKSLSGISTPKSTYEPKPKLSCNILHQNQTDTLREQSFPSHHYHTPLNQPLDSNCLSPSPQPTPHHLSHQKNHPSNQVSNKKNTPNQPQQVYQAQEHQMYSPPSPKMEPCLRPELQLLPAKIVNVNHCESVYQNWPLMERFTQIIEKQIDHHEHSHLHDQQCFLSEDEIVQIMVALGYEIEFECEEYFHDMLVQLEYDIYGGVPSGNLRDCLKIIDGYFSHNIAQQKPQRDGKICSNKIINNNLKICANASQQQEMYNYYHLLRSSRKDVKTSKTVHAHMKFEEMLAEKNIHMKQISDRILGKSEREPPSDEWRQKCNDSEIIQLKKRLNQALEKVYDDKPKYQSDEKPINKHEETFEMEEDQLASCQASTKKPILSVDVNLGEGISEKIIVCEGENAKQVSERLVQKYGISEETRIKFEKMLEAHLNTMLWKIDEVSEQLLTDRQ